MTIQAKVRILASVNTLCLIATLAIMVKFIFLDRLTLKELYRALEDIKRVSAFFADQLSLLEEEVSEWSDLISNKNADSLTGMLEAYSADERLPKHGKGLIG